MKLRKTLLALGLSGLATLTSDSTAGAAQPDSTNSTEPAAASRFFSLNDGLASKSPWLAPGKLDFLYRSHHDGDFTFNEFAYNAFAWTPTFKGGGGLIDPNGHGPTTTYLGGFLRPLAGFPEKGDLILGAQGFQRSHRRDYEAQAEYRLPMGLGFGGGGVAAQGTGNDIFFGKITWRKKWSGFNTLLELQAQDVAQNLSPGGYAAVYNDQWMGVFGHDGEQWRLTGGYVAPTNRTIFRPAAEALYVDNSIGDFDGPRSLFVNATLRLQGGFLAHPARLGRAMGPQGLEFGNPLGFLLPTWNRRLETWEMGGLVDVRYERIWLTDRTTQDRVDGVVFPLQFFGTRSGFDHGFLGGSFTRSPTGDNPGVIAGWIGKIGFLHVNAAVEHRFNSDETLVVAGLIDWF